MTNSVNSTSANTTPSTGSAPKVSGLLEALDLMQLARDLARQQYLRKNRDASEDDIESWVEEWVSRPRSCAPERG